MESTEIVNNIVSLIAIIASAGWAGVAGIGVASLVAIIGSVMAARFIKKQIYKSDVDLSNASAGDEAVQAGNADAAAKQSANQLQKENEALLKKQELKKVAKSITKKRKTTTNSTRKPAKKHKKTKRF